MAHSERDLQGNVAWIVEEGADSTLTVDVDWVIIAIGQTIDPISRRICEKLAAGPKGTLVIDHDSSSTNMTGVFAAGDIVNLPGSVTEAMAMGRKAAAAMAQYLQRNEPKIEPLLLTQGNMTGSDQLPEGVSPAKRPEMQCLATKERIKSFSEVELGFNKDQAMQEAKRCLKCRTCNRCLEATQCVAFLSIEHGGKRSPVVRGSICEGCGRCARACPYHNIYLA